jgi:hypothetical protein
MKSIYVIASIASVVLGGMVLFVALVGAATNAPSPAPSEAEACESQALGDLAAFPMWPALAGEERGVGMDTKVDMPPALSQRYRMMMNAEMGKDDAACLLALKQELTLTPEQSQKLAQVLKESRQAAAAILTPEQRKILAEVSAQAASMNAIHAQMHANRMRKMQVAGVKTAEEKARGKRADAGPQSK